MIVVGKGGLVLLNDGPEAARKLVQMGKENNATFLAYTHPDMRHPWNRQNPSLWAATVVAWIERRDLPAGFLLLYALANVGSHFKSHFKEWSFCSLRFERVAV
jgi:hypothetical protein